MLLAFGAKCGGFGSAAAVLPKSRSFDSDARASEPMPSGASTEEVAAR